MTTANMAETKRMKRSVSQANRVQVYGRDFLHPQKICPLSAGEKRVEHADVERHIRRNEPNFIPNKPLRMPNDPSSLMFTQTQSFVLWINSRCTPEPCQIVKTHWFFQEIKTNNCLNKLQKCYGHILFLLFYKQTNYDVMKLLFLLL